MLQVRNRRTTGWVPQSQTLILTLGLILGLPSFAAEVNHCTDADTCWVKDKGQEFKVRLYGVDAPESDQPYGQEAKRFMNNLVGHKTVMLKCLGNSYDRRTCDIFLNGQDVSEILVRTGYAWDYPEFSKGKYAKVQAEAKAAKVGLWQEAHPASPYCWRWTGKPACNRNVEYEP